MRMKRLFAYGAAGLLMAGMVVMPVSAHGHHSQAGAAKKAVCSVCTVEGCTRTGLHVHDNTTYCGYAHAGGYCDGSCGAVSVCAMAGCTETGYHLHDSQTYCGYDHACGYCDGSCGVVGICTVAGCTETGYHAHDGQTYCGYDHECGYCDGSCVTQNAGQGVVQSGGHHGGHHGRHHS